jgi:hypothetical protein
LLILSATKAMLLLKRTLLIIHLMLGTLISYSQIKDQQLIILKKLDSLRQSPSIACHFASIYFASTIKAVNFFQDKDDSVQLFMQRLETRFASLFFNSVVCYNEHTTTSPVWKTYFSDTSFSFLQYQLLGINAHINGDIWKALTAEFTLQEIKANKKYYYLFEKRLIRQYNEFYNEALISDKKTLLLHQVSFGLDKLYGKLILNRWRKRQMRLAILYYSDPVQFEKKLKTLQVKMKRLDNMIVHNL